MPDLPESPQQIALSLAHDTAKWLHQRLTRHLDRLWDGPPTPPTPPAPPAPPVLAPPSPILAPPAGSPTPSVPAPATTAGLDPALLSYSATVAQGIACLQCTNGHLVTAAVALRGAASAAAAGDAAAAQAGWIHAAAELDALTALDWHPQKLAATPAADQAVIAAVRDCVTTTRAHMPLPPALGTLVGLAAEGARFATGAVTAQDVAELTDRLTLIDEAAAWVERLSPTAGAGAVPDAVRAAVRAGRHVLDQARLGGTWTTPGPWRQAHGYFVAAAQTVLAAPDTAAATAARDACDACLSQFRMAFLARMQARQGSAPA